VKTIPLSQGAVALVDDADFAELSRFSWYLSDKGYAVRNADVDGGKRPIRMHRVLLGAPDGVDVDHIDGNRLNNTRGNLRLCERRQNLMNSRKRTATTSKFKGVYWLAANRKWRAKINIEGKSKHLGCFAAEEDAARAYDQAAKTYFGEFARTNLIQKEAHHAD